MYDRQVYETQYNMFFKYIKIKWLNLKTHKNIISYICQLVCKLNFSQVEYKVTHKLVTKLVTFLFNVHTPATRNNFLE